MISQSNGVPFAYDFDLSYFENFLINRRKALGTQGNFGGVLDAFDNVDTTRVVSGITVNGGVDIKNYIQRVYNGDTQTCLLDKIHREIMSISLQAFDLAFFGNFGSVGCAIANFTNKIFDSFTDVFGSFICTATLEQLGTKCGKETLAKLKKYRDDEVLSTKEGKDIVRYYGVLGPLVVTAINEDEDKDIVYKHIMAKYILPLKGIVSSSDVDKDLVYKIYFALIREMRQRYNIDVSKTYLKWEGRFNGMS